MIKKIVFQYAIGLASLLVLGKIVEYLFLSYWLRIEFYIGLIALCFTMLGVWVGVRWQKIPSPKNLEEHKELSVNMPLASLQNPYQLSQRELEVLELMSKGYSNQEIADKLFLSLPTIKTHTSNLFIKMDVKRRTQAVKKAKDLQIIS